MSKSNFNLYHPPRSFQTNDSFLKKRFTQTQHHLTFLNTRPQVYFSSPKQHVTIDKRYVVLEKQFNKHYKDQLKINEAKFNKHYYRCLEKLAQEKVEPKEKKKVIWNKPVEKTFDTTCLSLKLQKLNQRLVKSDHKIFEETFNKISERDESTQLSVEPLRFKHKIQSYEKPGRKFNQMDTNQILLDKPSSSRSIIKDLQELQENRSDKY